MIDPRSTPPKVLTLALNPALDHTLEVDRLCRGEVNRALRMQVQVGGKGFNVASCLADFGVATAVTGLLGRENATRFEALFRAKGIDNRCFYLDGQTRINTKLVECSSGETTDLNMPGPALAPEAIEGLLASLMTRLDELLESVRWVVLAGSLPPLWPEDTYRRLALHVRKAGGQVALDTSGPALVSGLEAAPELIKPNRAELAELTGCALPDLEAVVAAGRSLLLKPQGPRTVAVSMGAEGALFLQGETALLAHPLPVDLVSTVGAGDAMVAGLIAAQLSGLPLAESARLATAFSAAKLAGLGPHLPAPEVVRALAAQVRLTCLD